MRNEKEILNSVMELAAKDETIRAVIRTDLVPVREYISTYNFCFIVNAPDQFDCDDVFASCFGERILLYRGDRNYPELFPNTKAHLMVFRDGITLVINAMDRDAFLKRYNGDPAHENVWIGDTFQKLLDKDGMLTIRDRLEEKQVLFDHVPTASEFGDTCSEFWWVLKTLAEYTLREELPSAMFYLHAAVRDLLNKMLRWHIRLREGRPVDMGILDSNLERLLENDWFRLYRETYPDAEYTHLWEAFHAVVLLWHRAASDVAARCGFRYDDDTENRMLECIGTLRKTKRDETSADEKRL